MNANEVSLMRSLVESDQLWGVQHIPPASPLGPTGYVVNIGFKHFRAENLEDALSQALTWWKEQRNAPLPEQ